MPENKIYCISGASGFIGQAITKRLKDDRHIVVSIRRDQLQNVELLEAFFDTHKPDEIIHLASYGNHYFQTDGKATILANVLYTYNLLKASGKTKVYNVSSSSVMLRDRTLYSITKLCGEQLANLFPSAINIRPYSVFGPGEADHRFIPTVIRCLMDGREMMLDEFATHDWIYIDDFISALLNGEQEIGTGVKHSNLKIVRILEKISRKKLKYKRAKLRSYDNPNWVCPNGVAHRSIEEALLQTYNHYAGA